MSYSRYLISKATIWDVTQSTALGISESTSFAEQIDCRIRERSGKELMNSGRETNIGSHQIYSESGASIDNTSQMVSEGNIYHVKNVRNVYGRKGIHHMTISAEIIS